MRYSFWLTGEQVLAGMFLVPALIVLVYCMLLLGVIMWWPQLVTGLGLYIVVRVIIAKLRVHSRDRYTR
jgi:hypothetical protein